MRKTLNIDQETMNEFRKQKLILSARICYALTDDDFLGHLLMKWKKEQKK